MITLALCHNSHHSVCGALSRTISVSPNHEVIIVLASKHAIKPTLLFQLEDMFQLISTPQDIEKVTLRLKDAPAKVYVVGAKLFLSKVPLEVFQN